MVLTVEKNQRDELVITNLPDQYKFRKFRFGGQPNCRILAYRKCIDTSNASMRLIHNLLLGPDVEKLSFAPALLGRYPQKNYAGRELQSAIAMVNDFAFVFHSKPVR